MVHISGEGSWAWLPENNHLLTVLRVSIEEAYLDIAAYFSSALSRERLLRKGSSDAFMQWHGNFHLPRPLSAIVMLVFFFFSYDLNFFQLAARVLIMICWLWMFSLVLCREISPRLEWWNLAFALCRKRTCGFLFLDGVSEKSNLYFFYFYTLTCRRSWEVRGNPSTSLPKDFESTDFTSF